jgi:hypothetical protein
MVLALVTPPLRAQCTKSFIEIWVDPVNGTDFDPPPTAAPTHIPVRINNPANPTKTIQRAIDLASGFLFANYHPIDNRDQHAIVHLLEGITRRSASAATGSSFRSR